MGMILFVQFPNPDRICDMCRVSRQYILSNHYEGEHIIKQYYNFPINREVTDNAIREQMQYIYQRQRRSYRVKFGAG